MNIVHSVVCLAFIVAPPDVCLAATTKLFAAVNTNLVDTRLDPLVDPGKCTSHVHSVFGNANFNATIRKAMLTDDQWFDDTGKVNQTTSNVIPNLSMYWAPSMYIYNPNDDKYYIVRTFTRVYYRIRHPNNDISAVNPIPEYLRFIVGNSSRKDPWLPGETHDDIRWTFRDTVSRTSNRQSVNSEEHGDWSYIRDNNLSSRVDQLEMNVNFPTCLQRKNGGTGPPRTRSDDWRSHGAYQDGTSCSDGDYTYQIPVVNIEVRYLLNESRVTLSSAVVDDMDNWYLSTGDQSGAGAHADFVSGWPEDLMANIIVNCTEGLPRNPGDDCLLEPYFQATRDEMGAKKIPFNNPYIPQETVDVVDEIPGLDGGRDCL